MLYRTLCEVLEEMRVTTKTLNFSYLLGLIEEAQTMGNRMEDAGYCAKEVERLHGEVKDLKRVRGEIKGEIELLRSTRDSLDVSRDTEEESGD